MTGLPSLPPVPFRTMIRDKKAVSELGRTNFSAFSLNSFIVLVLGVIVLIILLGILL